MGAGAFGHGLGGAGGGGGEGQWEVWAVESRSGVTVPSPWRSPGPGSRALVLAKLCVSSDGCHTQLGAATGPRPICWYLTWKALLTMSECLGGLQLVKPLM